MTKRSIDIDDDLLERARAYFKTTTIKDTVNEALREIAAYPARLAEIDHWLTDPYRDAREFETLKKRWQEEHDIWSTKVRSSGLMPTPLGPSSENCSIAETSPPAR